jgi:hypothetical protein
MESLLTATGTLTAYFAQRALAFQSSPWVLRQPGEEPGRGQTPDFEVAEQDAELPEEEAYIVCRQCRQAITRSEERFSIQGAHRHTFANPHGLVFEIGCFKHTVGCGYAGQTSDEFTWFAGYRWRICFCSSCLTHLGWLFTSTGGDAFHGLILERLLEPK